MPVGKPQLDRLSAATDRVRLRMERLISGRAPSDPLYTSRTVPWQQKMKTAALVGVPLDNSQWPPSRLPPRTYFICTRRMRTNTR